jgi:hypothetical protein
MLRDGRTLKSANLFFFSSADQSGNWISPDWSRNRKLENSTCTISAPIGTFLFFTANETVR